MANQINKLDAPKIGSAKIKDAMRFLDCSRSTVNKMRDNGELDWFYVGNRGVRITWESLYDVRRNRVQAEA